MCKAFRGSVNVHYPCFSQSQPRRLIKISNSCYGEEVTEWEEGNISNLMLQMPIGEK